MASFLHMPIPSAQPMGESFGIMFTSHDLLMNLNREQSPLHIIAPINGNTTIVVLVDHACCVNVITEDIFLINFLHKDRYNESRSTIHTQDGICIPPLGCITLSVLVGPNSINALFDIILGSKVFRVKLGIC